MQFDGLSQVMQKQQAVYIFLQGIYEKELTKKFLNDVPKKMKLLLAVNEKFSNTESRKAIEELVKFTDSISSKNINDVLTALAVDYARLFLSINKVPPHPSESTYREGVMMQHHRDEVLQTYWSFGVTAKKEFTEPEDHIASELSFMAYLCDKAGEAFNNGNKKEAKKYVQAQKDFLELHLSKWVPALVKDIMDASRSPFYKGIAALTNEFIFTTLSASENILEQLKG
jgi:putative dimethyl sulfoxide reductase chaperone